MNLDQKFSTFLIVAKALNKHGIIPAPYGSLGLYRLIGQLDEIDDIDIVIPQIFFKEKFSELIKTMEAIGYKQDETFPHEFTRGEGQIGFETEEELKELAEIDLNKYQTVEIDEIKFKELTHADYLVFYKKAYEDNETKQGKKKLKIEALEKFLGNKKENNFAFIDSQNVNLAIRGQGWILNWQRFGIYLKDKYKASKAFLFIGYVEGNEKLYKSLQEAGFICVFKPTLEYKEVKTKGNCDAELVLYTMIEYKNYDKAIIVTGDGDFYCLADYLLNNKKLNTILIPNKNKFSALLKFKQFNGYLRFMNDLRGKLEYQKKRPHKDETL